MPDFDENFEDGKLGESEIAGWAKEQGFNILPIYEVQSGQYKGPTIYTAKGIGVIAPDMLVFKNGSVRWIEAKHKSSFTWSRKYQCWETGIDLHHYYEYLKVMEMIDWPLWLMFLHKPGKPAPNSPGVSPTGLYGRELKQLSKKENISHVWEEPYGHQRKGMIYWNEKSLIKLSEYPL